MKAYQSWLHISLLKKEVTATTIRKTIALAKENTDSVAVCLFVIMLLMN